MTLNRCIRALLLLAVTSAVLWIGYQIGYHKASLDLLKLAALPTAPAEVTQPSAPHTTPEISDGDNQSAEITDAPHISPEPSTVAQSLQSMLPEDIVLTLIDIMPLSQLTSLMQQTSRIPVDKLTMITDPRALAKQLLVASNLLDAGNDSVIAHSTLGYSDLQVSLHINAERQPAHSGALITAGKKRLYISFEAPAEQNNNPYYLIKIAKQTVPTTLVYFKPFSFTDNKRQYVWVERDWLAGDYSAELFILEDALAQLQTVYFSILPQNNST